MSQTINNNENEKEKKVSLEDLKPGDRIYVRYGTCFEPATVFTKHNGVIYFKLSDYHTIGIQVLTGYSEWFPDPLDYPSTVSSRLFMSNSTTQEEYQHPQSGPNAMTKFITGFTDTIKKMLS